MLWRLVRVTAALIAAITLGSLTLLFLAPLAGDTIMAGVFRFLDALSVTDDPAGLAQVTIRAAGRLVTLIAVAPILVVGLAGEAAGWRSGLWYIVGTALLTAAVPWLMRAALAAPTPGELRVSAYLAVAGCVSGTVYWLIAGMRERKDMAKTDGATQ